MHFFRRSIRGPLPFSDVFLFGTPLSFLPVSFHHRRAMLFPLSFFYLAARCPLLLLLPLPLLILVLPPPPLLLLPLSPPLSLCSFPNSHVGP